MKKHTGAISRVTLSFDMTFFALVRLALTGDDYSVTKGRCAAHPIRRRPMMRENASLAYAANVSAILVYHKVRDTLADDKGVKKLMARSVMPYANGMCRRAKRADADMAERVAASMQELARLEAAQCPTPDAPADLFGNLLSLLLSAGLDEATARIAGEIGLHIGRFIYLADAVLDYEEDQKSGAYNPFALALASASDMAEFRKSTLRGILTYETDAAMRAFALLDCKDTALCSVIENIICDGMHHAVFTALAGKEESHGKGSI